MAVNSNATTPCFPLQPSSDEAAAAAAARANTAAQAAEDATEDASQAASDANDAKDAADAAVEAVNAKLALVQTLEEIYGGAYVNEQVSGSTINITDGADNVPVKALSVTISGASPALTAVTINKTVNGLNTPYTMSLVSGETQLSVTEGTLDFVNGVLVSGGVTYNIDGGGIDVPTSLGANTFTTSAGVMDMTYRADIDLYLQETYLALANLENAVVGNAKQLVATVGINDNAPYLFRTSGGTADIGDRETDEIVGGTVAWNQLTSASTSGTVNGITYSYNSTTGVMSLSGEASANYAAIYTNVNIYQGHKYLSKLTMLTNPNSLSFDVGMLNDSPRVSPSNSITIMVANGTKTTGVGITAYGGVGTDFTGVSFKLIICDLTVAFGSEIANHVYSLETATAGSGIAWLRKYAFFNKPYYPNNAGQLMSVKTSAHKMVGFNAYNHATGIAKVTAGDVWQITGTYTALSLNGETVTPDSNGYFTPSASGALSVTGGNATDTCIHLKWDGERDGEYAPYIEYNYPLDDDLELRGIAKLDANNNLYYDGDTYASDGTVTRKYGVYTFTGNEGFQDNGTYGSFYNLGISIGAKSSTLNIITDIGLTPLSSGVANTANSISIGSAVNINIGNDGSTVKTNMTGKTIVYELATPTTETAEPYTNPQIVDDFGTEEYIDEREVPIPVGHNTIYSANLRAKLEMAPDSPDGDGDYIVRQINGINVYVPLPVSNVYQHNAVITLADSAGTVYLTYVSKLATAYNIVDIGSTDGAPTTTPIYPVTGYYDSKAVVAVQFGTAPAITVYLADGTNASTTMTALADTVG